MKKGPEAFAEEYLGGQIKNTGLKAKIAKIKKVLQQYETDAFLESREERYGEWKQAVIDELKKCIGRKEEEKLEGKM